MSFASLMKDSGQVKAFSSANEYGKDSFGSAGTAFPCRLDPKTGKRVVTTTGEDAIADGVVYFPASVSVNEKDRLVVNSVEYRILSLALIGQHAANHHWEAAVRRIGG